MCDLFSSAADECEKDKQGSGLEDERTNENKNIALLTWPPTMAEDDENDAMSLFDIAWEDVLYVKLFPLLSLKDKFNLRCCSKLTKSFVDHGFRRMREVNLSGNNSPTVAVAFEVLARNCRNVRVLNLARCHWIDDSNLFPFLQDNHRLSKINISDCPKVTTRSMQPVIIACKQLTTLKLAHCHWLTIGAIEALTLHHTKIQELDVSYCATLNERCISVFLLNCRTLRTLSLANVPAVTDNLLFAIAKHSKLIKHLNLIGCYMITDRGIGALALCCKELESLMVRECPHVTERSLALIRGRVFIDRPRLFQPDMNMVPNMGIPRLYLQSRKAVRCDVCLKMASKQSSEIVCRICSANTSLARAIYIFSISGGQLDDGSKTIADNIAEFADVTINNDDEHSQYLCPGCFKAFNKAVKLRQQIRDAESAMLSVLQSIEMQGSVVEYELEYLEEFRDQVSGTVVPKELMHQSALADVRSDVEALSEGEDDLLAKQMTLQLSEEELDTLEVDPVEQGRFVFEMPSDELIARRIVFTEFEYLEIHGERCCGCPHIAATHDELVEHAGEKHSQNYYADSSYTCPTCYNKFPTEEALSKHIQYYSYNDVFLCTVCQKAFNFHSHLMLHRTQHHEEAELAVVEQTDVSIKLEHDEAGADKNPAAKRCRKTESTELTVLPDARFIKEVHERPDYREYQLIGERCCSCGVLQDSMEAHVAEMHLPGGNTRAMKGGLPYCTVCRRRFSSEREKLLHEEQRRTVNQIYECRTCGKIFRRRLMLMRHLVKHAKETKVEVPSAATENATVSVPAAPAEASAKVATMAAPKKQLVCYCCCFTRCQQEYNTEKELLSHALEAHNGRRKENEILSKAQHPDRYSGSLFCPICLRVFESARKLAQHRLYKAQAEKNRCHHCGRCFIKPHALREHQEREHLDLPPEHACDICGKHFLNRTTLLHHHSVHGPFKKIPCAAENCDIVFRDERLMRRHFRNVHAEHTPYECPHCQKKYRSKEALDIHVRCHTGDRPFPCRHDGCTRRFSHGTDRLRHERAAHTGERPHKCPSCGATFIRRRELRIHFNRQHKET
ncbi:uncharacterized protein LOC128271106 [Anopheles cruzii]|uniref:uncharacterized protein LOC128271106 n=1 Tax=Anopheles cruzii TaxID=68878 RepID=UPI0022EC8B0A|nr:uncharacterized protein LOC128271106 [Anopheles cruzii]